MSAARAALAAAALVAWVGASTLSAQAASHAPPRMLHPAAGKQDCLSCHGAGANAHITSVPATHHFANGACGMCHKPIAETPTPIKHAVDEVHAECRKCHAQAAEGAAAAPGGAPSPPASHAKFEGSTCKLCHEVAAAPSPGPGGG